MTAPALEAASIPTSESIGRAASSPGFEAQLQGRLAPGLPAQGQPEPAMSPELWSGQAWPQTGDRVAGGENAPSPERRAGEIARSASDTELQGRGKWSRPTVQGSRRSSGAPSSAEGGSEPRTSRGGSRGPGQGIATHARRSGESATDATRAPEKTPSRDSEETPAATAGDALLALAADGTNASQLETADAPATSPGITLDTITDSVVGPMQTLPKPGSVSSDAAEPAVSDASDRQDPPANAEAAVAPGVENRSGSTDSPEAPRNTSAVQELEKIADLRNTPQGPLAASALSRADLTRTAVDAAKGRGDRSENTEWDGLVAALRPASLSRIATVPATATARVAGGTSAAEAETMVNNPNPGLAQEGKPSAFGSGDAGTGRGESETQPARLDGQTSVDPSNSAPTGFDVHARGGVFDAARAQDPSLTVGNMDGAGPVSSARSLVGVEALRQEILNRVVEVRHQDVGSMTVVLRPDAGTELNVQLRNHDGGVEVVVRVERGEADVYQASWRSLQHAFSQHGVRLADLQAAGSVSPQGTAGVSRGASETTAVPTGVAGVLHSFIGFGGAGAGGSDAQTSFNRSSRGDSDSSTFTGNAGDGHSDASPRDRRAASDPVVPWEPGFGPGPGVWEKRASAAGASVAPPSGDSQPGSQRLETWA